MASSKEVAQWMFSRLQERGVLHQHQTAWEIFRTIGKEHVYINKNGNRAISPEVLEEFNRLSQDGWVWSRGSRKWRERRPTDKPGRAQR